MIQGLMALLFTGLASMSLRMCICQMGVIFPLPASEALLRILN